MSGINITSTTITGSGSNYNLPMSYDFQFNSNLSLIERTNQIIEKTDLTLNQADAKGLHSIRIELLLVYSLVDKDTKLDTDCIIRTKKVIENQILKCEFAILQSTSSFGNTFGSSISERKFAMVFECPDGQNLNLFEIMMRKEVGEIAFDYLVRHMDQNTINSQKTSKAAMLNFAFSPSHYSSILIQPDKIPSDIQNEADQVAALKIPNITDVITLFSTKAPGAYMEWLKSRGSSSTTISGKFNESEKGFLDWISADTGIRKLAKVHAIEGKPFNSKSMGLFHKTLTSNAEDVKYKGESRDQIMLKDSQRCNVSGGTWQSLFCPPQMLQENLTECFKWYNDSLSKCHTNEYNPIILASQIYQRILSLHPYENGNGRVARCMMDYTLMRFDLPPCVLKDVRNDGVLPLQPVKDHSLLIHRVINGVKESLKSIRDF